MTFVQPSNPESESPKAWARRVWASWSAAERGEFVGAVQLIMEANNGAGDGNPARKRRRDNGRPSEWKAGKYPWYRYNPDAKSDHVGRWD